MTISPERIEAEIAAEVKRIQAWNYSVGNMGYGKNATLTIDQVVTLANHLVRNRLQVEDARRAALLEAAKAALEASHDPVVERILAAAIAVERGKRDRTTSRPLRRPR